MRISRVDVRIAKVFLWYGAHYTVSMRLAPLYPQTRTHCNPRLCLARSTATAVGPPARGGRASCAVGRAAAAAKARCAPMEGHATSVAMRVCGSLRFWRVATGMMIRKAENQAVLARSEVSYCIISIFTQRKGSQCTFLVDGDCDLEPRATGPLTKIHSIYTSSARWPRSGCLRRN